MTAQGTLVPKIIIGTIKAVDRAKRQVRFVASRQEVDRDGEVVVIGGVRWNLTDPTREKVKFKKDHGGEVLGTILDIQRTVVDGAPALVVLVQFLPEGVSAAADQVYAEIQAGARDSYSMGFLVIEADMVPVLPEQTGRTFRQIELVEISSVVNASNRGAVTLEKGLSPTVELPAGMTLDDVAAICREVVRDAVPRVLALRLTDAVAHIQRSHRGHVQVSRRWHPDEVVLELAD